MSNGDYGDVTDAIFFEDTQLFLTVAFADDPLGPLRLMFQMKVYFISVSLFKSTQKRDPCSRRLLVASLFVLLSVHLSSYNVSLGPLKNAV